MNLETGYRRIDDTGARSESSSSNRLGYPVMPSFIFCSSLFFFSGGRKCINDTQEGTQGLIAVFVLHQKQVFLRTGDSICSNDHEFQQ